MPSSTNGTPDKKRPLVEGASKPPHKGRSEHPLSSMRQMMEGLYTQIKGLQDDVRSNKVIAKPNTWAPTPQQFATNKTDPKTASPVSLTKHTHIFNKKSEIHNHSSHNVHQAIKEKTAGAQLVTDPKPLRPTPGGMSKVVSEVTQAARQVPIEERSVRIPSPGIALPRPSRTRRNGLPISTPADQEANRQLFERQAAGSHGALPAAVRLAKLVRAEALLAKEPQAKGGASAQIQQLAQAIREGQRRSVADMPHQRTQELMKTALGNSNISEQQLSSPSIARMIDKHQTLVTAVRNAAIERQKRLTVKEGDHTYHPSPVTTTMNNDFHVTGLNAGSSTSAELDHMMATNDDDHIGRASAHQSESDQRSSGLAPVASRPLPKQAMVEMSHVSPQKGGIAQSIASAIGDDNKSGSSKNSRIEGTMKLVTEGGVTLGKILLDGVQNRG